MSFSATQPALLHTALDNLKRRNPGQTATTNYFFQPLRRNCNLRMSESSKSVCFICDEWDFGRLHLLTYDLQDLQNLFRGIQWPAIVVLDWISRNGCSALDPIFREAGFHPHAVYDRIVCRSFRPVRLEEPAEFATAADLEAIHAALFQVFDKYADHINSIQDLAELIEQRQVIVSRDSRGGIEGLVAFPISGSSCNFNFLYNNGGAKRLVRLLGSFYGTLTERGVQSGFSWVRRTRPMVLKLHQSFGWQTDGLVDHIFLR
jgi:hypothetical protein